MKNHGRFFSRPAFMFLAFTAIISLQGCEDQENPHEEKSIDRESESVIYGDDNRLDLYQVNESRQLEWARSTGVLVESSKVTNQSGGMVQLDSGTFGGSYTLCQEERFKEQANPGFCSGFLVGPDTFVTAGHCISNQTDCSNTKIAFGFSVENQGQVRTRLPASDVYSCAEVIQTARRSTGADFAVIRLDRSVTHRDPLPIRRTGSIHTGDPLVIIGHPMGLPTKVAAGANVRSLQNEFFVANLDSYGGNSGSAVFNENTGEVEGILVRGEIDLVWKGSCRVSKQCTNTACRGEDVTRISQALQYIPDLEDGGNQPGNEERESTFSSSPSVAIPDKNSNGVKNTLSVNEAPRGRAVQVNVSIRHSYRGDLKISLVSPNGTEIVLKNTNPKDSADHINGTYGKELVTAQSLNALSSVTATGNWTLKVADLYAADKGTLVSWKLIFSPIAR